MPSSLITGGTILSPGLEGSVYSLASVEALVIGDGRIAAAGRMSELDGLATSQTQRINLEGRCFNLRAMFDAGLTVAFSSDGPVVQQVGPLSGLQAAIFEPLCTGNGVSLEEALWAYTVGGAIAQGDEDSRGSLKAGHLADLVVLEGEVNDSYSLSVHQTMLGGV
jgi:predicted amidohydrolase YtcJ